MEVLFVILYVGLPLVLLILFSLIGGSIERAHEKSLAKREAVHADFLITTLKTPYGNSGEKTPMLVTGDAVISSDYFKNWLFGFRNVFGGESRSFTRLFDRARREATQRMIDSAVCAGYDAICNVRFESTDIGGNASSNNSNNTLKMAVCTVSGTAYKRT